MSNIFYTEVDANLQAELNERGQAGRFKRSSRYIKYMTEKIANVEITAYEPPPAKSKRARGPQRPDDKFGTLGGYSTRGGRYMPSGDEGYLNSLQKTYTRSFVEITQDGDNLKATLKPTDPLTDNSRRIAPFIKTCDISIGDGSMGLLNKATIAITVPNPTRDLDDFESTWMRPGRHVTLTVRHPDSAIITKTGGEKPTNALLTDLVLPDDEKLKKLYPDWNIEELKNEIRLMNEYTFSGLITNFDLSYTEDASADITLQLTGTSDIYTDISLIMNPDKEKKAAIKTTSEIKVGAAEPEVNAPNPDTQSEFYEKLSSDVDNLRNAFKLSTGKSNGIVPFKMPGETNVEATDRFILFGQPFDTDLSRPDFEAVYEPPEPFEFNSGSAFAESERPKRTDPEFNVIVPTPIVSNDVLFASASQAFEDRLDAEFNAQIAQYESASRQDKKDQREQYEKEENEVLKILTDENRYITIGGLVHFLNTYVASKQEGIGILLDDVQTSSTYYKHLKSNDPENVLLLPKDPSISDADNSMNWYGTTGYYADVVQSTTESSDELQDDGLYQEWPGVYQIGGSDESSKILPSRIFINLAQIDEIVEGLSENKANFKLGTFLQSISSLVNKATAGAIKLVLTENKLDKTKIVYADSSYIDKQGVTPYSVPMFANHPNGTIVQNFQLSAKLPSSVKNLSYVLNQGTDISEEKIAPYMNFMFNADNAASVQKIVDDYKLTHDLAVQKLKVAADKYGASPQDSETAADLKTALLEYLKYPTNDIRKTQQMTAPIFPFDASFTIDGINGLRYGDVLTFDSLPKKYTANTVFSIIGINHTISTDGFWQTKVTCIMRPNID